MRIVFFAVAILLSAALYAYADCHNTHSHEKVKKHLVDAPPDAKWVEPYNNTVEFLINPTYSGKPNLLEDAKYAAKLWSDVEYGGRTIHFEAKFSGETDLHPGGTTEQQESHEWERDNKNVVGYK